MTPDFHSSGNRVTDPNNLTHRDHPITPKIIRRNQVVWNKKNSECVRNRNEQIFQDTANWEANNLLMLNRVIFNKTSSDRKKISPGYTPFFQSTNLQPNSSRPISELLDVKSDK